MTDEDRIVHRMQIELLYEALPKSLVASSVVAIALCVIQYYAVDAIAVQVWLILFLLLTVSRLLLWHHYQSTSNRDYKYFDRLSMTSSLAAGAIWGSAGVFLFPVDNMEHQFFLAFALAGMAAGSVAVLSYRREQAWGFITLILLPITIQWMISGHPLSIAEGAMTLAFTAVLYSMAAMTARNAITTLKAEVTAEKVAAAAARDRDFLKLVIDTIPARVFWKDSQSRYIGSNELFAHDAGFNSVEELIGKCDEDLVWRDQAASLRASDLRVIESGEPLLNFEDKALMVSGSMRMREISKAPIRNSTGNVIGVLGTYHDITEKLEIETQLRQAQKMEAVGTLVAGIAHEFNNMLATITGNLYLARNQIDQGELSSACEYIDLSQQSGFDAAAMIRQLMTFSRKDQSLMKMATIEMNAWLTNSAKLVKSSVPGNVTIQITQSSEDVYINADSTLLLQILVNLANNACDALGAREHPCIEISLTAGIADKAFKSVHNNFKAEEYVALAVADNGEGIPESVRERIFEPFFTTKSVGSGTGLGLAIVQGAMQSHRGCIDLQSATDQGTTFSLYFPRLMNMQNTTDEKPVAPADVPKGHGELILIADDEPNVLLMLAAVLTKFGYNVIKATDGEEAVSLFAEHAEEVRMVILDVIMPNMIGPVAARKIREIRPSVPLAFCTGYSQEEMRDELKNVGNFNLLSKPFQTEELGRLIGSMISS